ncbi:MAG TPA: hypothetical protein VEB21_10470 [Terriglobales bacterium]|nr:hypothetical protein [Terriglobales bacterium]
MTSKVVVMGWLAAMVALPLARPASAQNVAPCSGDCARLTVGDVTAPSGGTVSVPISFEQAPSDGQTGGPDEIAAIAFSLNIPGDDSHPLRLSDCFFNGNGLPGSVRPDSSLANFRVVVENASCSGGRSHCLCPEEGSGITPDNFINIVVYGPNPLPTPGPGPIEIPVLPSSELMQIDLAVEGSASGTIALHVTNEVTDAERPPNRAFLSIGDREAVDQTCEPVQGTPPCSGDNPVSQIIVEDGSLTVGSACVGDCDGNGAVTVDEIITMVNIALGNVNLSQCTAGDSNQDGQVTVDEIVTSVNNALFGC